ncbi:MAG: type II toxin-antitoxin system VapC family toxin [Bacteroidetes bacterium]|nr:type II toxin-antitoxin system VapC family toxin [Bacteroidota bacterium]
MGEEYLIDTNAVVDYLGKRLPPRGESFLDKLPPVISVITRIELLGWYKITPKQTGKLMSFVSNAIIHNLSEPIIIQTIQLRQKHKIKTPDAIIAATALINNLTLITRNTNDFINIEGLKLFNPFDKK